MEGTRTLVIPKVLNQQMLADVKRKAPEEACGVLAGRAERVMKVFEITNTAHSPVRFYMAPEELLQALLSIDQNAWELIGIYHSHPNGPPFPSPTDLGEFAYPGAAYLIWFQDSGNWECKGFDILVRGAAFPNRKEPLIVQGDPFFPVSIQVTE